MFLIVYDNSIYKVTLPISFFLFTYVHQYQFKDNSGKPELNTRIPAIICKLHS